MKNVNALNQIKETIQLMVDEFIGSSISDRDALIRNQVSGDITPEIFDALSKEHQAILGDIKDILPKLEVEESEEFLPTLHKMAEMAQNLSYKSRSTVSLDFVRSNRNEVKDFISKVDEIRAITTDYGRCIELVIDMYNMSNPNKIKDGKNLGHVKGLGEFERFYTYEPLKLDEDSRKELSKLDNSERRKLVAQLQERLNNPNIEAVRDLLTQLEAEDVEVVDHEVEIIEPHEQELKIKEVDEREAEKDKLNKFIGSSLSKFISYLDKYEIYLDEARYKDLFEGTRIYKKYSFEELEAVPSFRKSNSIIKKKKNK